MWTTRSTKWINEMPETKQTYYIKRHYAPHLQKESHAVEGMSGLTLAQAKKHCSRKDTQKKGEWFDAFHKE